MLLWLIRKLPRTSITPLHCSGQGDEFDLQANGKTGQSELDTDIPALTRTGSGIIRSFREDPLQATPSLPTVRTESGSDRPNTHSNTEIGSHLVITLG